MASQPVDFVSGLGALPNPQQAMDENIARRLGQERAGLQNQHLAAETSLLGVQAQAKQRQMADADRYKNRLAETWANPTPENYSKLFAEFPEQKDAISKSWDTRDESAKRGDLRQIGEAVAALRGGHKELAVKSLRTRVEADKEAGIPDEGDQRMLDALTNDDPSDDAAVLAMLSMHLAAVIPDQFAKTFEAIGGDAQRKGQIVGRTIGHYDETGKFVTDYRDPDPVQYRDLEQDQPDGTVKKGIVALGGDGGQRFTGGWTPRERHGGDNPDTAVDNKIAGVAKALGVDPSADISNLSPLQIAKALAYGEGGKGSLADRNNNPTNLRVPGSAEYRRFSSTDAALTAAAVQVKRNLKRGQTTVQSMIEGLPAKGGNARVVALGATIAAGDPVDPETVQFYADKVAAGGDLPALGSGKSATAWRQAILKKAAQIQSGRGLSGGESNLAQADVKANRSALLQAQKQYTSTVGFEDTFQRNVKEVLRLAPSGVAGGVPAFNRWIQAGRKNLKGDPAVSAFNVAVNTAANEYAKLASGASGGAVTSDSARHEAMEILNNAQTLPQLQASIRQMQIDGHNRVVALDTQIKRLRGNISGAGGGGRSAPPKPGMVQKGYRYKGGNPASPSSWVKI